MSVRARYSAAVQRMGRSAIRESMKLAEKPGVISFSGGWPHPDTFPVEELRSICGSLLDGRHSSCLQYGSTEGAANLRAEVIAFLKSMGVTASENEVLITTASQQSIDLVARVFLDPGDCVAVEDPSFISALAAFRAHGARFLTVPMDGDGMDVSLLREELLRVREGRPAAGGALGGGAMAAERGAQSAPLPMPKFIYTIPDFQNPTGISLSVSRRRQLLEVAREFDLLVVEDVPYRWLRYSGEEAPLLASLDTERRVISLYSFSKIFAPGLRVGWVAADAGIVDKLVQAKQAADLCTSAFSQAILAAYLRGGALPARLAFSTELYGRKLRLMRETLEACMPALPGLSWTAPQGGVFLWVRLPAGMNAEALLVRSLRKGVAFIPGDGFHANGGSGETLRLCFSFPSEDDIRAGIPLLAGALREAWDELVMAGGTQ
jgi:2-aminoadipate transaminase